MINYGILRKIYDESNSSIIYYTRHISNVVKGKYFIECAASGLSHDEIMETLAKWRTVRNERAAARAFAFSLPTITSVKYYAYIGSYINKAMVKLGYNGRYFDDPGFRLKILCNDMRSNDFEWMLWPLQTTSDATHVYRLIMPSRICWYSNFYKTGRYLYRTNEGDFVRLSDFNYIHVAPGRLVSARIKGE